MSERCSEIVYIGQWARATRCSRNAVKDGFCKQHHPESKAERAKKSEEAYKAKRETSDWYLLSKARERIAALEKVRIAAKNVSENFPIQHPETKEQWLDRMEDAMLLLDNALNALREAGYLKEQGE